MPVSPSRVVIIGGGPGGYEAALVAAQLGADVTLVDSDGVGGSAVLTDCVPSKTLIATAELMTEVEGAGELGVNLTSVEPPSSAAAAETTSAVSVDLARVNARVLQLAHDQSDDIAGRLEKEGVRVVRGRGRLDGPDTVVVEASGTTAGTTAGTASGGEQRLAADAVLLATGAAPRTTPEAQPDGERILTWEQVYDLTELPEHLVVVGSGVTGAEFASAYLALGARVTLVSSRDRVLPGEDADAATVLEEVLTRRGMEVLARSRMASVTRDGDSVTVTLTDGRTVRGSHCILAVGSVPNTRGLGLETAGVDTDDRGFVVVDRVSRTTSRGVYAAGDCTGVLMLASVAAMQGRIAMWHFLGDAVAPLDLKKVSSNVFTAPEIATVGWSQEAVDRGEIEANQLMLPLAGNAARQDAGRPRRLREALLPARHGDRGGRRRGRPTRQRADPPGVDRGRRVDDRRPARAGVHGLPVHERVRGRGGPQVASRLTSCSGGLTMLTHLSRPKAALVGMLIVTAGAFDGAPARAAAALPIPPGATLVIHGRGFGHGHGMSQYGAQGAAKKGLSTRRILAFYYPHTATGHVGGSVRVLITENIGQPTVVVAQPGLQVHDLAKGTTVKVPTRGAASKASRWRMSGATGGRTEVSYRAGGWHVWRTLKGDGEFRSGRAPLTLVLGHDLVTYAGTLRSVDRLDSTTHRITVNKVSLEGYVRGVVPREMPSSWKPAALRAQAVAARTYAAFEVRNSSDPRFDLCDDTSCQVYGGLSADVASTDQATSATAGQVRTYQGQPAFTQFSASNGGELAPSTQPYLVGKADPYDTAAVDPYTSWTVKVGAHKIDTTWPALGRVTSIQVTSRDGKGRWGGRILALTLHGTKTDKDLTGDAFRSALGLRSSYLRFSVSSG